MKHHTEILSNFSVAFFRNKGKVRRRDKVNITASEIIHQFVGFFFHAHFCSRIINPLVTGPLYLACMTKNFDLKKRRDHRKNFLWSSRLWIGRRYEPLLSYIPEFNWKQNSGTNWLNFISNVCNHTHLEILSECIPQSLLRIIQYYLRSRINNLKSRCYSLEQVNFPHNKIPLPWEILLFLFLILKFFK